MNPPDIERHLLGCALAGTRAALAAIDCGLTPEDFSDRRHALTWSSIRALALAGEPVDCATVSARMTVAGERPPLAWLVELVEQGYSIGGSERTTAHLAQRMRLDARVRRFGARAAELASEARGGLEDPDAWFSAAQGSLLQLTEADSDDDSWSALELSVRAAKRLERMAAGEDRARVPCGIPSLDRLGLLERGQLSVIAARPGVGKTALALNVAIGAARGGARVLFVSREMPEWQILRRMLGIVAGVRHEDLADVGAPGITDPRTMRALGQLGDLAGLRLWCPARLTEASLLTRARRYHAAAPLDVVAVDYLQLIGSAEKQATREQEVARVSEAMTSLAKGLNVAVLALAQLNREAAKGPPALHHLRESGSIEADAALVALLQRPGLDDPSVPLERMELAVLKNRNGPEAQALLRFEGETQRCTPWR
jgi:replicative DNA helicase